VKDALFLRHRERVDSRRQTDGVVVKCFSKDCLIGNFLIEWLKAGRGGLQAGKNSVRQRMAMLLSTGCGFSRTAA